MFVDTSGLLCYLHRDEPQHGEAVRLMETAESKLTHNYVIAEFIALAAARRLPRREALSFAADLLEQPDIEVIWIDESVHQDGMDLLSQHGDKSSASSEHVRSPMFTA
jgi:uncharacterized protein